MENPENLFTVDIEFFSSAMLCDMMELIVYMNQQTPWYFSND